MSVRTIAISFCLLPGSTFTSYSQPTNILPLADSVKVMAEQLIKKGFNAGDGYGEVWIRDFNTFMDVACKVNDKTQIRKSLITFILFQQPDGAILDGYIPKPKSTNVPYRRMPPPSGSPSTLFTRPDPLKIRAWAPILIKTAATGPGLAAEW